MATIPFLNNTSFSAAVTVANTLTVGGNANTGRLFVEQSGADMIDMTRTGVGTYRFAISGSDAFSLFDVGANADRLIIDNQGFATFASRVGIGVTASTNAMLDVKGPDTDNAVLGRFYSNTGARGSFIIKNGSGTSPTTFIGTAGGSEQLAIGTNSAEAIRIDASQNTTFAGLVSGITPVAAANFVTKAYVDGSGGGTGPFLPLAGGTLTGNLFITKAVTPLIQLKDTTNNKTLLLGVDDNNSFIRSGANQTFFLQVNDGSSAITMLNNGNVGIGTTSPAEKLHVNGEVRVDGNDGVATKKIRSSYFSSSQNLDLQTGSSADIILTTRNVGIGTTTPTARLDVRLSATTGRVAELHNNTGYGIGFTVEGDGGVNNINSESNQALAFATNGASNERMRIAIGGNVGIGTTAPTQSLHISGNMRLTGAFRDRLNSQGAANYVLTSTGSNGTQWVDASGSSIIGGPYLPLAGGTMTGDTIHNDNVKSVYGTSGDGLKIFHDGGDSFIRDLGTGNLLITSDGASVQINKGTTENMAEFIVDGAVKLYYDSGKKFETTSTGVTITGGWVTSGVSVATANVEHTDNVKSLFGNGNDLEIFHDSTASVINNKTGGLFIKSTQTDGNIVFEADNGAGSVVAYFSLDGGSAAANEYYTKWNDNSRIALGNGKDLQIYHASSTGISFITNSNAGGLRLQSDELRIFASNGSTIRAHFGVDVELYHNDVKKFETTSTGIAVTGNIDLSASLSDILMIDNSGAALEMKQGSDLYMRFITTNGGEKIQVNKNIELQGMTATSGSFSSTVTAPTFLGDLNGTINTATTAVTQDNASNNTRVATTAFVNNRLALIPAGLVFQGTWNAATNTPTLASGTGTTGHFYIVSVAGSTNLDGITDWKVGDWAVFIEQGASDQWEKIDNSSVLDGIGTGGSVAGWAGSGTSNTLTNAPITFSGNNSTFAGNIVFGNNHFIGNGSGDDLSIQSSTGKDITLDASGDIVLDADGGDVVFKDGGTAVGRFKNNSGNFVIKSEGSDDDIIFKGNDGGSEITALTLDMSNGGNATFAGAGTFGGQLNINPNATTAIRIDTAGTNAGLIFAGSSDELYIGANNTHQIRCKTNNDVDFVANANFAGDINITQTADVGVLNTTNLDNGSAVGLSLTYPTSNVAAGDGLAIAIGIAGRGRSYIANSNTTTSLDASNLAFYTESGGVIGERMIINQDGKVGIGATNPSQLLHVKSATSNATGIGLQNSERYYSVRSNNFSLVFTDETVGAERMRINSSGKVGIGTTAPSARLDVGGNLQISDNKINANNKTNRIKAQHYTNAEQPVTFMFLNNFSTSNTMFIGGGSTVENSVTSIQFYTAANNTTTQGSERMRIDSSGNVMIGNTGAGAKLDVRADTGYAFRTENASGNTFRIEASSGNIDAKSATFAGNITLNGDGRLLKFTPTSYDDVELGIDSNGFVIYNTTDARYDLKISGTGNATFSGLVSGITPVAAANFVTKAYVDGGGGAGSGFLPLSAGSTKKLTDTLYIQGTNTTGAESVLLRGVSSNDGDFLGSIRTANLGGFNQEMRFYTSDANGTTNENLVLTLDEDKNAIFAGHVFVEDGSKFFGANAIAASSEDGNYVASFGKSTSGSAKFAGNITVGAGNSTFAGNVGIGTTSPIYDLDIQNNNGRIRMLGSTGFVALDLQNTAQSFYVAREGNTGGNFATGGTAFAGILAVQGNYNLEFATNGVVRQTITGAGNVGIGTASPGAFKLSVENTTEDLLRLHNSTDGLDSLISFTNPGGTLGRIQGIDNGGLAFDVGNNAGGINSNAMFIKNNGNVGIGTTSPGSRLSIGGTTGSYNSGIGFQPTGTGARIYRTFIATDGSFRFDDASVGTRYCINAAGNFGIGTTSPTAKLEVAGNIGLKSDSAYLRFRNAAAADLGYITNSTTWGDSGNDFSIGASSANLRFYTNNAATEKMRIDSIGNVGIGMAPRTIGTYKVLDLSGSGSHGAYIGFNNGATSQAEIYSTPSTFEFVAIGSKTIKWFTGGSQKMTLLSNGNVGIGTTSPDLKLDVTHATAGEYVATFQNTGANLELKLGVTSTSYLNIQGQQINNSAAFNMSLQADGGNVGIGTTTPDSKLDVKGPSATPADGNQTLSITNTTGGTQLNLGTAENSYGWIEAREGATLRNLLLQPNGGNVGIGTTSPGEKLEVVGNILTNGSITLGSGKLLKFGGNGARIHGDNANNFLTFDTNSVEKMRITANGNVGIGITNPANKLQVVTAGSGPVAKFDNTSGTGGSGLEVNGGNGTAFALKIGSYTGSELMRVQASGNVGIGTASPATQLEIYNGNDNPATLRLNTTISDGDAVAAIISFANAAGSGGVQGRIESISTEDDETVFKFYTNNTSTPKMTLFSNGNMTIAGTLTQNSDARLKENIKPIESALDKVKQMQGVEFNKINNDTKEIGIIAQDIEKVIPELVVEDKEGIKSVAYGNITAVLIEAIKEQQKQIEELKQQLNR